jgi:hypothetical protein
MRVARAAPDQLALEPVDVERARVESHTDAVEEHASSLRRCGGAG